MKMDIISLSLIFFSVIVIVLGIVKLHTYPEKIARARNHPQAEAIGVTALMGLLIFPLWMAALVWAYSGAVIGSLYNVPGEPSADVAPPDDQEPTTKAAQNSSSSADGAVEA